MDLDRQIVSRCERQIAVLRRTVFLLGVSYAVTLVSIVATGCNSRRQNLPTDLTVRGISVVDDAGTVRVRIGAPLPDPISNGQRGKRDDAMSGMLIHDAAGDERGGYVTDSAKTGGNALLSLDSKDGQVVTLVAYPQRGAEIGVQRARGSAVALRSLEEGSSILILNGGQVSFRIRIT